MEKRSIEEDMLIKVDIVHVSMMNDKNIDDATKYRILMEIKVAWILKHLRKKIPLRPNNLM
jgi:hypothetical protein